MSKKNEYLNINDVTKNLLPCPFCGEKPDVEKYYLPATVEVMCNNENCNARPRISESVECVKNEGDTETYSPMFDRHWKSIIEKWNRRIV